MRDKYLTLASSVKPRPGLSVLDESPWKGIERVYFRLSPSKILGDWHTADAKTSWLPRHEDEILAPGAACGLDSEGNVRHLWPGQVKGFLGFMLQNVAADYTYRNGRAVVQTRGAVNLRILPTPEGGDVGKPVFALGPDEFTLDAKAGGFGIGILIHRESDELYREPRHRAIVLFKSFKDAEPFAALRFRNGR